MGKEHAELIEKVKQEVDRHLKMKISTAIIAVTLVLLVSLFTAYYSLMKAFTTNEINKAMTAHISRLDQLQYEAGEVSGKLDQALLTEIGKMDEKVKTEIEVQLPRKVAEEIERQMKSFQEEMTSFRKEVSDFRKEAAKTELDLAKVRMEQKKQEEILLDNKVKAEEAFAELDKMIEKEFGEDKQPEPE
jgi:hypothetical protein